ncbi:MAG: YceI family protein [Chitinophagaceae bacterium]
MKKSTLLLALLCTTGALFAQKKTTTSAIVMMDATTPKDALPKAENKTVIGSIDMQSGAVAFEAAVANFSFSNPRIQEHFNGANWMNSAEFPKFTYTGKIEKPEKINWKKNGTYDAKVDGQMTIKGVTQPVKVKGTITVTDGKMKVNALFDIKLKDFGISGQPIQAGKVAEEPKISVSAEF